MRVNGKYFTIGFAVFICIFFAIVWSIFRRHEVLGELIKKERAMWPKTAQALDRYFESRGDILSSPQSPAMAEWTDARAQFAKSTIYDSQALPATRLIALTLVQPTSNKNGLKFEFDAEELRALREFREVDALRDSNQTDLLGIATYGVLFLNYPPPIHSELAKILP